MAAIAYLLQRVIPAFFVLAAVGIGVFMVYGRVAHNIPPGTVAAAGTTPTASVAAATAPFEDGIIAGASQASGNPMFVDVAPARGMSHIMSSWGLTWNDYNADGMPDLFVADHMHFPSTLYANRNGLFFERATELGTQVGLDDHQAGFGDLDGDGLQDVFIAPGFYRPQLLFRNMGDERFEEVSEAAGLEGGAGSGRATLLVDYTGDGCLDIAAYNNSGSDDMYRSNCDGTFDDIGYESLMTNQLYKLGAISGDLDNDGDIDFVNFTIRGVLVYINRGDGVFAERSAHVNRLLPSHHGGHVGGALGDYDNDGDLDIYIAAGQPNDILLRNLGDATFEDASAEAQLTLLGQGTRTPVIADFNNDGWLDVYVVAAGHPVGGAPNQLVLNRGDGTFFDASAMSGTAVPVPGIALSPAVADFNSDGRLDIVLGNGEGDMQISGQLVLLENRRLAGAVAGAECGHWLMVHPRRMNGSYDDHAATIRVRLSDGREIERQAAPNFRPLAQDHALVHFGLGCAAQVDEIVATWPDGAIWRTQNVPVNSHIFATAGSDDLVRSHPASLLAAGTGDAPLLVANGLATPEAYRQREDEVLAHALAQRLLAEVRVDADEISSFVADHSEQLGTPERVWLERFLLGVFTPRKKQPRLPWDIAKQVKTRLQAEATPNARDIAEELNIRAWSTTDRKLGRYWGIEGETRGFVERGWFTKREISLRYGPELAEQLFTAQQGRVFGPLKFTEQYHVFNTDDGRIVPQTLHVVKVVAREAARPGSVEADGWRVHDALHRAAFTEAVRARSCGARHPGRGRSHRPRVHPRSALPGRSPCGPCACPRPRQGPNRRRCPERGARRSRRQCSRAAPFGRGCGDAREHRCTGRRGQRAVGTSACHLGNAPLLRGQERGHGNDGHAARGQNL